MKKSHLLTILISIICLSACNNHSEDDMDVRLPIAYELEPRSTIIQWGDMTSDERKKYHREGYVVNSLSDLPDNLIFSNKDLIAADIDFSQYTLLLYYQLFPGYVISHYYGWCYNNPEKVYRLYSNFETVDGIKPADPDSSTQPSDNPELTDSSYTLPDDFTYYRSAIVVPKIPASAKVEFWLGVY